MALQKGKVERERPAYYCVIYLEMCDIIFTDEKRKKLQKTVFAIIRISVSAVFWSIIYYMI